MSDLVERVREALYYANPIPIYDNDGSTISHLPWSEARDVPFRAPTEEEARAAIAEVRRFDVEFGPSDAEVESARGMYELNDVVFVNGFGDEMSFKYAAMPQALNAAAKVRAEEVTE